MVYAAALPGRALSAVRLRTSEGVTEPRDEDSVSDSPGAVRASDAMALHLGESKGKGVHVACEFGGCKYLGSGR